MTKEEFKEKVRIAKWEFNNWCFETKLKAEKFWNENRDYIVVLAPVVLGAGTTVAKTIDQNRRIKEEKNLKERFIYDRSLGTYYELRRQPKQSEYLEISRRKSNGEPLGKILKDMRLAK